MEENFGIYTYQTVDGQTVCNIYVGGPRFRDTSKCRTWRWRTVKPWPQLPRMPHPLAHRVGEPVRELVRGRNGNALLEFPDGFRTIAPWRAAL